MTIAKEEIFGPVLVIMPYKDDADAVKIANDTPYGLGAYIAGDPARAKTIVPKIRAGAVFVNAGGLAFDMPFGGYKQSGNGREFGKFGLEEFLEVKSVIGALPEEEVVAWALPPRSRSGPRLQPSPPLAGRESLTLQWSAQHFLRSRFQASEHYGREALGLYLDNQRLHADRLGSEAGFRADLFTAFCPVGIQFVIHCDHTRIACMY